MKVFVSWSGERSKAVAEAIAPFLRRVVQALNPWISIGIGKGARSGVEISRELENAKVGLICLTPENLEEPWINFEAGALSKVQDLRVCTLLLDLTPGDVAEPLAQFQHTLTTRDQILQMTLDLASIAREAGASSAVDEDIRAMFDAMWPMLEQQLNAAQALKPANPKQTRTPNEKIEEILERVREIQTEMQKPKARIDLLRRNISYPTRTLFSDLPKDQPTVDAASAALAHLLEETSLASNVPTSEGSEA